MATLTAKRRQKREMPAPVAVEQNSRFDLAASIAFNVGLVVFLVAGLWYSLSGPSLTAAVPWWKFGLTPRDSRSPELPGSRD